MSSIAIQSNVTQWHWLRDARFDLSFIVGIFTVSVAAGLFVTRYQDWFWVVLIFDLWFRVPLAKGPLEGALGL